MKSLIEVFKKVKLSRNFTQKSVLKNTQKKFITHKSTQNSKFTQKVPKKAPKMAVFFFYKGKYVLQKLLNIDRNSAKLNLEQKYGPSHFKSAFKIDF